MAIDKVQLWAAALVAVKHEALEEVEEQQLVLSQDESADHAKCQAKGQCRHLLVHYMAQHTATSQSAEKELGLLLQNNHTLKETLVQKKKKKNQRHCCC
jgi:hypothetical protein